VLWRDKPDRRDKRRHGTPMKDRPHHFLLARADDRRTLQALMRRINNLKPLMKKH
jgi:hypothetical protein